MGLIQIASRLQLTQKKCLRLRSLFLKNDFQAKQHFLYSSEASHSKVKIFTSKFTDPYINLGVEEWITSDNKHLDHALYFYQNRPSVVIGRNQNPWNESNLKVLVDEGIELVRRKSGGGTVYHDLGNSNYFALMPRDTFKRFTNANLVKEGLRSLDIPAELTERKDIAVDGFKVSGSAYKITSTRAYHHGTMLLSADLAKLKNALHPPENVSVITKGVASVRSPVTNLSKFAPITHDSFCNAVIPQFLSTHGYSSSDPVVVINEEFLANNTKIVQYAESLKTWDWKFGQTPEFTLKIESKLIKPMVIEVSSKYGRITKVQLGCLPWIKDDVISLALATEFSHSLTENLKDQLFRFNTLNEFMASEYRLSAMKRFGLSEAIWNNLITELQNLASPAFYK